MVWAHWARCRLRQDAAMTRKVRRPTSGSQRSFDIVQHPTSDVGRQHRINAKAEHNATQDALLFSIYEVRHDAWRVLCAQALRVSERLISQSTHSYPLEMGSGEDDIAGKGFKYASLAISV